MINYSSMKTATWNYLRENTYYLLILFEEKIFLRVVRNARIIAVGDAMKNAAPAYSTYSWKRNQMVGCMGMGMKCTSLRKSVIATVAASVIEANPLIMFTSL